MRLPQARLDQVLDRYREVEARMGAASDGAEIVRLSKEHAELRPVAEAVRSLERALTVVIIFLLGLMMLRWMIVLAWAWYFGKPSGP